MGAQPGTIRSARRNRESVPEQATAAGPQKLPGRQPNLKQRSAAAWRPRLPPRRIQACANSAAFPWAVREPTWSKNNPRMSVRHRAGSRFSPLWPQTRNAQTVRNCRPCVTCPCNSSRANPRRPPRSRRSNSRKSPGNRPAPSPASTPPARPPIWLFVGGPSDSWLLFSGYGPVSSRQINVPLAVNRWLDSTGKPTV